MQNQRGARVSFTGDLDVYRRDEFAAALPDPAEIDQLVLDLREVTFIESAVIAMILRFRRSFVEGGGDPREIVVIAPPQLRPIFDITGLTRSMTVITAPPEPVAET